MLVAKVKRQIISKLLAQGKCRALLRRATAVSHNGRMFARLMPAALNVKSLSAVDTVIAGRGNLARQ